ncbi:MAG: DEAD/DEAH box helicase [Gemmatimonadetes bacterium]|nr:DEAD/DEAH box helicase [Gemmatimonadota bacterium]
MTYVEFFRKATGHDPYPYQQRLAAEGLPEVLRIDTGCGKTEAAGLAWLWRRRHFAPKATPRWLVYTLPMRTLVDQTVSRFERWRDRLSLSSEELGIHQVMGGIQWKDREWRLYPERDAVFIGTTDMLLSRALNRGFADSQWNWPISFGAFNSGCQWVFDEPQLMDSAVVTGRQLQAFRELFGTVQPTHTMWMSATVDSDRLRTVNAPCIGRVVEISPEDRQGGPLMTRLGARRTVQSLGQADDRQVARHAVEYHRPGTLTLVVLNTVKRAQGTFRVLQKLNPHAETALIHSRFRRGDRETTMDRLLSPVSPEGRIVVSTQVVEAGLDLSATTLLTDLAPWSSIVQRSGRCNRDGMAANARMFWMRPHTPAPYSEDDLQSAEEALMSLPEVSTPERLSSKEIPERHDPLPTLRRRDLVELFDTMPDLTGGHIDVGRFIRNTENRDVMVAWRSIEDGAPSPDTFPAADELCRVPIAQLRKFVNARKALVLTPDPQGGQDRRWSRVWSADLRPNLTVIVDASAGGYSSEFGWDSTSKREVTAVVNGDRVASDLQDVGLEDDPHSTVTPIPWVSLGQHLADAEMAAAELTDAFGDLALSTDAIQAARLAARYHDLGKAHPVFQEAIRKTGTKTDPPPPEEGTLLAKGGSNRNGLRYSQRYFRHGLVSALMLLGPEKHLLDGVAEPDLVVYLAAAHHGRVRLGVRRLAQEHPPRGKEGLDVALGVVDGDQVPRVELNGNATNGGSLNLAYVGFGSNQIPPPSYTARMLTLLDRLGPFRLAWLEMLVRLADWRASAHPGCANKTR